MIYIRMFSEKSCDTEDWSNDAENTALTSIIIYIIFIKNYFIYKILLYFVVAITIIYIFVLLIEFLKTNKHATRRFPKEHGH